MRALALPLGLPIVGPSMRGVALVNSKFEAVMDGLVDRGGPGAAVGVHGWVCAP